MGCTNGRCSRCGVNHNRERSRTGVLPDSRERQKSTEAYFKARKQGKYPTKAQKGRLNGF